MYAVEYTYGADTDAGRDAHRPAHRAWLRTLLEAGELRACGPYADGSGALLFFEGASAAAVRDRLQEDPFVVQGFVTGVRVTEWVPVMGPFT